MEKEIQSRYDTLDALKKIKQGLIDLLADYRAKLVSRKIEYNLLIEKEHDVLHQDKIDKKKKYLLTEVDNYEAKINTLKAEKLKYIISICNLEKEIEEEKINSLFSNIAIKKK